MMHEFFISLPNTFLGWMAVLGFFVFGAIAIYGLFDKRARERKKEVDGSEDRLIDILQKTVSELETKVNKQTEDIEALSDEVEELRKENKRYIEIFQGKDKETQEFQKAAYKAMDTLVQTHDIITTVAQSIKDTNSAMQKLIDLIGKSMDIAGQIAQK